MQLILSVKSKLNFICSCILANPKSKLFEPLLTVLSHFHMAKNNRKVQSMVHKLWEPLLWRYLKVANSDVRVNATQILSEAFPIENPNDELEVRASGQEMQIRSFHNLLRDEVPDVRVVAVQGVCSILSRFWVIFETTDLQQFMITMIKDLANDMSSPKVRLSVVKGLTHIIQTCPRSHTYLKKILPKLKDLIFDSNDAVRLAMYDLLIAVKNVKTIQFWNICPLENILDRLSKDRKPICAKIAQLLFNSFFPLEEDEEAKLERCTFLINHDVTASR